MTARLIAEGGDDASSPQSLGGSLYWTEMRPLEDGRYVLVRRAPGGEIEDVTPPGVSARTLVHEYGGGMYAAFRNERGGESALFSDQADQRLYRQDLEPGGGPGAGSATRSSANGPAADAGASGWSAPRAVTPAPPAERAHRYADGRVTPDGLLMVCVRERHEADASVVNELVSLPTDGSAPPRTLAAGHDFYAAPRLSHDGRRLAWLSWDHPSMPWDGTELWVAELAEDGGLEGERGVAGGPEESVLQPLWSPAGDLHFASDRTGWWNLYRVDLGELVGAGAADAGGASDTHASGDNAGAGPQARPLVPRAAEFAKAPWVFGLQHFAFLDDGTLVVCFTEDGRDHLAALEPGEPDGSAAVREIDSATRSSTR